MDSCNSPQTRAFHLGMTMEDQWIGDLGHLALADATLGALLVEVLTILAHAEYPEIPTNVDHGVTTKQAAKAVQHHLEGGPELFGDSASNWLADIVAVTDARNKLLHAVALNRCGICGAASRFIHPRSGDEVDRSEQAIQDLTAKALSLHKNGMIIAEQIAERVNARIVERARQDAEATGEVQAPPQVSPRHVTHKCANCTGSGRGSTTVRLGTAVMVSPPGQMEAMIERLRKLPRNAGADEEDGNGS